MTRVALLLGLIASWAPRGYAQVACPTPDDVTIQTAIADTLATGGGVVQLVGRVYEVCQPVVIPSNIHLKGAGVGATILRTTSVIPANAPLAVFGASIIGAGVNHASVTDLSLDQRSNGRVANGIAFVPSNPDGTGTPPTIVLVARNRVIGVAGEGLHQYFIWNVRGQHVKILDNWVDGGYYQSPPAGGSMWTEGIESLGGYDVLVQGNTVEGIAGSCLNFGSSDGPPGNDETNGLIITDNYTSQCYRGLNLGSGIGKLNADSLIRGNVFIYSGLAGIMVSLGSGSTLRSLIVSGNAVRNVNVSGTEPGAFGVYLYTRPPVDARPTVLAATIQSNHIDNVGGAAGYGIELDVYDNARVLDNVISATTASGIYAYGHAPEIRGNRVRGAGHYGIRVQASDRPIVVDNFIRDWSAAYIGLLVDGATYPVVRGNVLHRTDDVRPLPLAVSGSCGVVSGNVSLYSGGSVDNVAPTCP